jgi:hypothetical protein
MQYRCLFVAALAALGGCAAFEPRTPPFDGIVSEVLEAARSPVPEQRKALARAQQSFIGDPSPTNRLRLATLLATLPPPLRDDDRAQELLQPMANKAEPAYGRFAALLSSQVAEHARLTREAERAAREREQADKERDKREEALRQQVEALRGIERGIREREERLRRRED